MNFLGGQAEEEIEFNLVPLIDVILTLLIFFMVSTTFEQRALLKIELPEASGAPVAEASQGVVLIVDSGGRYFINEREVIGVDAATLSAALQEITGGDTGQHVVVRADASATHQSVVTALDVLGRLGFSRIQIATVPAAGGS